MKNPNNEEFDIFIIGGGINGAGIARDAAGRGIKVGLADMNEVGGATSSWSTKLIHGGLRYLENHNYGLVKESLKERDIIHYIAPKITEPLPFIIPHTENFRPAWIIKIGLFLYDFLAGKTNIPKSSTIKIRNEYPNILHSKYLLGFKYYDLQIDDNKLVKLNIADAYKLGAKIYENRKVIKVKRTINNWNIYLEKNITLKAKILINATGPWVNQVIKNIINLKSNKSLRLIKGSHIVTKKLYDEKVAFTLQNTDKRIIFVIPYKKKYTLIGTTEVEVKNPNNPKINDKEIDYLIDCVNLYFKNQISTEDIVETFAGIRPLVDNFNQNFSKITRDYVFDLNIENKEAPLLNIYGGKLTTYRKLSEKVIENLKKFLNNNQKSWTHKKQLN